MIDPALKALLGELRVEIRAMILEELKALPTPIITVNVPQQPPAVIKVDVAPAPVSVQAAPAALAPIINVSAAPPVIKNEIKVEAPPKEQKTGKGRVRILKFTKDARGDTDGAQIQEE
jgi:hypothetical protein